MPYSLIHDYKNLLSRTGKEFLNELYKLKKNGLVDKIGISIYSPDDLEIIWKFWKPEIVQAPFNVFDKRIDHAPRWRDNGIQCQMISLPLFTQASDSLRISINNWRFHWSYWRYFRQGQ